MDWTGKRADTQSNGVSQTPQKQAYTNTVKYILTKVQGQFHKERIIFFNKRC